MTSSRRRHLRLPLAFPVIVELAGTMKRLMAQDVCEEGMLLTTAEPYPVGSHLRITFTLPSTDVELVAEAVVRHVEWKGQEPPGHFSVGLEFEGFDEGELHPPMRCLPC